MKHRWPHMVIGTLAVVLLGLVATQLPYIEFSPTTRSLIPPKGKYNVKILRDTYGVPHIYGKTDADCAYGLAYAHAEDDFATIQEALYLSRGRLSILQGKEAAPLDYLVQFFKYREIVANKYETDLSPEVRAICEAYADGYNHFAALHPHEVFPGILPATGQDIVAGFVIKTPFFFGLEKEMERLYDTKRPQAAATKSADAGSAAISLTDGLPTGSNTFAIAPGRTPDGKTHLAINSHQPWTGPVAWYEARLKSEEGLDITGGVFPGTPVILHGHNRDLGWAHTVNNPDLIDVYELEMNPDNPNQYKFDGAWKDLEKATATIPVNVFSGFVWPVNREMLYSVHGPVVRRPYGVYAVRYAGYGDIRQVEQWYRMGKARNLAEFEAAMAMQAIPSFNVGYADKAGNIMYRYNALLPLRKGNHDYRAYLPGNTSETLWDAYLPYDQLPVVLNPAAGFVANANGTPFRATAGPENPDPAQFPASFGIEPLDDLTNRQIRLLELLGADESITEDEFYAYKFDQAYPKDSPVGAVLQEVFDAPAPADPLLQEAVAVLQRWDYQTNPENTSAALACLFLRETAGERIKGRSGPEVMEHLKEKATLLQNAFGRLDPPWSEVNRLVRGELNVGLGGGPDVLNAVYGRWNGSFLEGRAGDCYVLMATWDAEGKVHSRSLHQFGSATLRPESPHYADQAPLFVKREMKPVWLDESELREHLEREYAPGYEPRPVEGSDPKMEDFE
jgi:acyl-homoserine-lactone acylase